MPRCGATLDENRRPPLDKGGLQGGFGRNSQPGVGLSIAQPTLALRATPPAGVSFPRYIPQQHNFIQETFLNAAKSFDESRRLRFGRKLRRLGGCAG